MLMALVLFAFLFIVGLLTTLLKLPTKKFTSMILQSFLSQNTLAQMTNKAPTTAQKNKAIKKSGGSSSTKNKADQLELKGIFATFDMNKDGFITKQELSESLKNIGMSMSEKDVVEIVEKADFNKDGLIDFQEFCELMAIQDQEEMINGSQGGDRELLGGGKGEEEDGREGDLKEAFDVFDWDRDGLITVEELGLVLNSMGFKEGKRIENCKEMIRQVDKDGDGMVNFDEFKCMMMRSGGRLITVS